MLTSLLAPHRFSSLELMLPLSLRNAMILPVRVMPPMKSPRMAATFSNVTPATGWAQKEPMDVTIAAKPTSEWKAATVCGSLIGLT